MGNIKAFNQKQLKDMEQFSKEQLQCSAEIPEKGICEPRFFSSTQNEDFSFWLKKIQAVARMNQWSVENYGQNISANRMETLPHFSTPSCNMLLTQRFLCVGSVKREKVKASRELRVVLKG